MRPRLPAVRAPVRLLVGEEDAATPVRDTREAAELLPDAEARVLPGTGHFPHVEAPDATRAALATWLGA